MLAQPPPPEPAGLSSVIATKTLKASGRRYVPQPFGATGTQGVPF
jgi:hypothetical protein